MPRRVDFNESFFLLIGISKSMDVEDLSGSDIIQEVWHLIGLASSWRTLVIGDAPALLPIPPNTIDVGMVKKEDWIIWGRCGPHIPADPNMDEVMQSGSVHIDCES
jgi:hypothetical protein